MSMLSCSRRRSMKPAKLLPALCLAASLILHAGEASARQVRMLIWYPGEAGSTAEAEPVLEEFFGYLSAKIAPDSVTGKYFNSVAEGLAYLKRERPAVAIVSYAAWAQNRSALAASKPFLSTLPLPHGSAAERYSLVSRVTQLAPGTPILSSEPLGPGFARGELFPDLPADAKISGTPQMIAKLKEIGEGRLSAAAILTPSEAAALARLTAPWAQAIKVIGESRPVPTARVILLDENWPGALKLKEALLAGGGDPAAREILDEMRLKGFAP